MAEDTVAPPFRLVIIGGSAGSLEALLKIFPWIDGSLNMALVIVVHRKSSSDSQLSSILHDKTSWPVKEAAEKEMIQLRHVYIAPGDYHLLFENDHSFSLDDSEKVKFSRPSIDVSFESAAEVFGKHLTGILLSGANDDGVEGLRQIKHHGGTCIVQEPATAEMPFMPQQAILHGPVDSIVLPDTEIGKFVAAMATN